MEHFQAIRILTGDAERPTDAHEIAQAASILFREFTHQSKLESRSFQATEHLQEAVISLLGEQEHGALFHEKVNCISERVSGHQFGEGAANVMVQAAVYWKDLDQRKRGTLCQAFTDHMTSLINLQFPLEENLDFFVDFERRAPVHAYNLFGKKEQVTPAVRFIDKIDPVMTMAINTHEEMSFSDGIKTFGEIFKATLLHLQGRLGQEFAQQGKQTPASLANVKPDIERLVALQKIGLFDRQSIERDFGIDLFVDRRFAAEQASRMTNRLEEMVDEYGKDVPASPPRPKNVVQRVFGL